MAGRASCRRWQPLRLLLAIVAVAVAAVVVVVDARVSGDATSAGGRELEDGQPGCRSKPFEDAGEGWQLKAADVLVPGAAAFGPDFVWGAATSSYQIEGGVKADGRGQSIWDTFSHTPGKVAGDANGDVACDSYRLWEEDVKLLKDLGVTHYRFSVAWPRVLPEGTGAVNQPGLDYYSKLVDALGKEGIEPAVTLYHWDLPQALQDKGGWQSAETAEAFAAYADAVFAALGDRVKMWCVSWESSCLGGLGF